MTGIDLKKQWDAVVKPPEGWQGDLYFYNRLGQKIRYGHAPATGEKKGTVVLTTGYGENIDLYYETIKHYQKLGYEVWGMDWQGHGKSERDDPADPLKPSARGMLRHTADLDFFVHNVVKAHHDPEHPLIMSTNSMGGHIGLLYLKKYPGVFDGAVMSTPMFDIYRLGMGKWARPLFRFIFNTASKLGFRDTNVPSVDELKDVAPSIARRLSNIFMRNTSVRGELRNLVQDLTPDAKLGRPTFGWIASAYKTIGPSMKEDFLKSIKTPILIGSADHEDLVANDAHKRAAALMPNAKNVLIKNSTHGLWFQGDGAYDQWWKDVESFLKEVRPENPHDKDNDPATKQIIAGKDVVKTLKGRVVEQHRGPIGPDGPALS